MTSQHTPIMIIYPDSMERHLWISVGACRLRINSGGGPEWVTGTYDDPTESLPCLVSQDRGVVHITQQPQVRGWRSWGHGVPTFELALGRSLPYNLTIETGASDTILDLGGLPLTRLVVKLGAGKSVLTFQEPNPVSMDLFDVDAGAGSIELHSLANANFADMTLDGGAVTFLCDFGGMLQRDASVQLTTAMASVDIRVPTATATCAQVQPVLGSKVVSEGYTFREGQYWSAAAIAGGHPLVSMRAQVVLGSLHLRATNVQETPIHPEWALSGV